MSKLLTLVSVPGLLDAAFKSVAVMVLTVAVVAALGRASAAWRHLVWCLSVMSLLLLPIMSPLLPDWRVAWLPQWAAKPVQLRVMQQTDLALQNRRETLDDAAIISPPSVAHSETEPLSPPNNLSTSTIEFTDPPAIAMPWLIIVWLAGGLFSLIPLAIGFCQLAGLHRRSQAVSDHRWLTLLDKLRRQLAVRRIVQLRECQSRLAPFTWGVLRHVLLVPFEADTWPDKRRRLVLLHELAHVRRWDWLTQLVAHVACAVYWFNPLVWLAARQMRIERERACDDVVLASGARASDYAQELLALTARLPGSRVSTLLAVPMARRGLLNDRLQGILDSHRSRAALSTAAVCLGAALAVAAMTPLAMLRAAPPDSTAAESVERKPAERKPPESSKKPPTAPTIELDAVAPQVKDVNDPRMPPAIDEHKISEVRDLTFENALHSALVNSKVLRNLGGRLFTPAVPQTNRNESAGPDADGSVRNPEPIRGTKVQFVLARANDEIALTDFESAVRNIVSDVERAYWELYYNYHNLSAVQAGRDRALQTWRKVHALHLAGTKGDEAEKEAQAREQYFVFRAQVENTLGLLYTAESRLRYMMGLSPADGRLIRPSDEPITAEIRFDWKEVISEGLNRPRELPQGAAHLQDHELELTHVLTNSIRDLDRNYQVSRTTFNRRVAATKQLEAVKASYDVGTATLDMLLDAQRRLADAEIAYYRALVDYNIAILQVHYRKGSLLEHDGILLAEGTWDEAPPIDPFRQRMRAP